jgi:hypothetical protein
MGIHPVRAPKADGPPDDAFFDAVVDVIGNLASEFEIWAKDDLDGALAALNAASDDADVRLGGGKKFFTIMHDFKGQAGMFGYVLLAEIGESACEYCRDPKISPTLEQVDILRLHIVAARFVVERNLKENDGQLWGQFRVKRDAMIAQAGRPGAAPAP